MKLAEALSRRADLQKKIAQIRERLSSNVKVQEGDAPAEDPEVLFGELDAALNELESLIVRINRTNIDTQADGRSLTELIAGKDVLSMRLSVLQGALNEASPRSDRYSRNEIKFVRTVDVNKLQKKVDEVSKAIRELDSLLQQANWTTDLL